MSKGVSAKNFTAEEASKTDDGPETGTYEMAPAEQREEIKQVQKFTGDKFNEQYGPAGIGGGLPGPAGDAITVGAGIWQLVKSAWDSATHLKLGPKD